LTQNTIEDEAHGVVATVLAGEVRVGRRKAERNLEKHDVTFEEAASAVIDPEALVFLDDSGSEERFRVIGRSWLERVLLVVIVERGARERIISARKATKSEEARYYSSP
jgi:uncharacterized DUF497 family protein